MQSPKQLGGKGKAHEEQVCYNGYFPLLGTSLTVEPMMRCNRFPIWILAAVASILPTVAAKAQVVQLPSFHNFNVSTSAWVPDAGTTQLGGINYSTNQSSAAGWGPYSSRSASGSSGGASASVSATIIDLQALDEAILAQAGVGPARPSDAGTSNAATGSGPLAPKTDATPATKSVAKTGVAASAAAAAAAYHQDTPQLASSATGFNHLLADGYPKIDPSVGRDRAGSLNEENVAYYIRKGREAERAGRHNAAKVYYGLAMDAMPPQLKQEYFSAIERRALEAEQKEKDNIRRAAGMRF